MAKDDVFLKLGFEVVDTAEPDFHNPAFSPMPLF
jgi:hypothetical protein